MNQACVWGRQFCSFQPASSLFPAPTILPRKKVSGSQGVASVRSDPVVGTYPCHETEEQAAQQTGMPSPSQDPVIQPRTARSQVAGILPPTPGHQVGYLPDSCSWEHAKEKTHDAGLALFSMGLECQRFLLLVEIAVGPTAVPRVLTEGPSTVMVGG